MHKRRDGKIFWVIMSPIIMYEDDACDDNMSKRDIKGPIGRSVPDYSREPDNPKTGTNYACMHEMMIRLKGLQAFAQSFFLVVATSCTVRQFY